MASTPITSKFLMVSIKFSPLTTLLEETATLVILADKIFAAMLKDVLVLVLASKKKVIMCFPSKVGTLGIGLAATSFMERAVLRINFISSTERSLRPRRSLRFKLFTLFMTIAC